MKFQVTIPPLTEDDFQMNVTAEGTNWRTALRAAIKKIGESADLIKNIECDVQDDGSFKVTDVDTKRVFTVREVPEAPAATAPAGPSAAEVEAQRRADAEKRQREDEERLRREQQAEQQRDEAARLEAQRQAEQKREQTIREEQQAEQQRAAEEAARAERSAQEALAKQSEARQAEQQRNEAEQRRAEEEKRQRDELRQRDESAKQKREEEERQQLAAQRQRDEGAKLQRDAESKRLAEETRKKETATAAKISETQKLSRPKVKGETIETRLGQKVSGADTVEFLSDAFDALVDLFSISNPQKAVEFVLDQALRKVPSEAGSVLFNDFGKRQLTFWATRGPRAEKLMGKSIPYGKGIAGYCVSKSVSLAIPDVSQDPRWDPTISEAVSYETRSILCAPLFFEGRCYGALQLLNRKSDSSFTRRELSVTNYLAEQLARWLNENGE